MSLRIVRVQSDLKRALASVFVRNNLQYIAIRNIYMSKDLRGAKIVVASLDPVISNEVMIKMLANRIGFIKRELRQFINLKYFPDIKFVLDTQQSTMLALEKLMKEVEQADAANARFSNHEEDVVSLTDFRKVDSKLDDPLESDNSSSFKE